MNWIKKTKLMELEKRIHEGIHYYVPKYSAENLVPNRCELCHRSRSKKRKLTRHHLIPNSVTKKQFMQTKLAMICWDCHRYIHSIFTNEELAFKYNSIELLKEKLKQMGDVK